MVGRTTPYALMKDLKPTLDLCRVWVKRVCGFCEGGGDEFARAHGEFGFGNLNNASGSDIYVAELSVAGKTYTVQLDTGSSDLWLDTTGADLSSLTQTGVQTGLTYGCVFTICVNVFGEGS